MRRNIPIWDYFIFNGKSCLDFGVKISEGDWDSAERDVDSYAVPGRSGELTIDNGRFKNKKIVYPAYIPEDLENRLAAFVDFMMSQPGYFRLEDTYHPEIFRLARYSGPTDMKKTRFAEGATFNIEFDAMPQKWLKSGEIPIEITEQIELYNPTHQTALPKIEVTAGTGELWIDDQRTTITANDGALIIDSWMQNCYEGTTNRNSAVSFSDGEYPALGPGIHTITPGTGMTIKLTPRWWRV